MLQKICNIFFRPRHTQQSICLIFFSCVDIFFRSVNILQKVCAIFSRSLHIQQSICPIFFSSVDMLQSVCPIFFCSVDILQKVCAIFFCCYPIFCCCCNIFFRCVLLFFASLNICVLFGLLCCLYCLLYLSCVLMDRCSHLFLNPCFQIEKSCNDICGRSDVILGVSIILHKT